MTDFRALCAELLNVFESYDDESNLAGIFDDMKENKNDLFDRVREALAQRHPQPVPVSERLPGPEDMTEDGEVWIEDPGQDYPLADTGDYDWEPHKWILRPIGKFDAKNGLRWLPAHALPLPGEVEG